MALLAEHFLSTLRDLSLIVIILFGFQYLVIRRPLARLKRVLTGFLLALTGLTLFIVGLELALFPLGSLMAEQLVSPDFLPTLAEGAERHWRDYYWIYLFAFMIGASTTIAEPALIAVSERAHQASNGTLNPLVLRAVVAIGMATGITLGVWRIVMGWPLTWFIGSAYLVVIALTLRCPKHMIPLAYDSGGVTTSTITVPIITALGLGLATQIPERSPVLDGFGMIALACLFPIISVMGYAIAVHPKTR
ncbi:MAG: DUF1538 domain-containing protein [Natronospirillum sp.]|uniref:DUF1538 domain-containing protein n=1 Tax=Natronospirillum sp. TaxID=2812955 RepID=UPI0025D76BFF|nr:DUF1538 domain-containing protein [Natronospirillum sp.]MCH8552220.1 DUF1538 domain-containing protein [Natronospirillum sp.]